MIPAAFEYSRASSVDEASKLLDKYGDDAKVLAGGHSLIPLMRLRLAQPTALVDINGIKGLDQIKVEGSKVHIGALVRHVQIQNSDVLKDKLPILAEVAGEVGDNQVRNMGTMGGVIAHADAAGDYPTIALMLDAEIVTNKRKIHAKDFFKDLFTTPLATNEIVTEVVFPVADGPHKYIKFRRRLFDWAIVGAAPTDSTHRVTFGPARNTRSTWRECSPRGPYNKRAEGPVLFDWMTAPASIDDVERRLRERRYIGDRGLATSIFLALKLEKPLFIEGEAGVGKTEAAKVMAEVLDARLIRLQCYEGIDLAHAVYEWNYPRQLLHIRLLGEGEDRRTAEREIFSSEFLLRRPLLDAIDNDDPTPPVLLIDEIDRSDEEFEAFLLELLSDFQISIPEIGTIKAKKPPFVVITSNRTREVHDALKRRCLYHWIDYPDLEKEVEIVRARAPEAADGLAREVAALVQGLRTMELYKVPGVAETLDWARSLAALGATRIDASLVDATLGSALKYQEDLERIRQQVPALVERARGA